MSQHNRDLAAQVSKLRQQVICTTSAVASMARVAGRTNPDRMLRLWTAEQRTRNTATLAAQVKK